MGVENSHSRGPRKIWKDTDGSFTEAMGGDVEHDGVDGGAPLKIGGRAAASAPSAVSAGDRVNAYFDTVGRQVVKVDAPAGSVLASTGDVHAPSANTAAVVTYAAAGAGVANVISGVAWSYDGDPTGGSLMIENGAGSTVFHVAVTSKGPGFFVFPQPKKGSANTAMIITLAAGGSGVTGKVNALNRWTES
ncbi:MAG: hypothetical protein ACO1SX_04160 [Actinomycetota bacterium]